MEYAMSNVYNLARIGKLLYLFNVVGERACKNALSSVVTVFTFVKVSTLDAKL